MYRLIYILPFSVFAGIMAQSGGFYLFELLLPFFLWAKKTAKFNSSIFGLGICLLTMHLAFSLSNFINANEVKNAALHIGFLETLRSQFPSQMFLTGWFLILISRFHYSIPLRLHLKKAFTIASWILFLYVCAQVFTGFDYRAAHAYRTDQMFSQHLYRAKGFYSHPLTFASACLAIFGFFYALAWQQSFANKWLNKISAIYFACLIGSGSRFAALIALIFAAFGLLRLRLSKLRWLALIFITVVIFIASGFIARFLELFHRSDERLIFWKVHIQMFLDKPWFGHGSVWLAHYLRSEYYTAYGFQDLSRQYNAHNIYIETLADAGIVGFLIVSASSVAATVCLRRILGRENGLYLAFVIAVLLNLIHGLTQNTFFDSSVIYVYLYGLVALIYKSQNHQFLNN